MEDDLAFIVAADDSVARENIAYGDDSPYTINAT
jgi:hypothetical protein